MLKVYLPIGVASYLVVDQNIKSFVLASSVKDRSDAQYSVPAVYAQMEIYAEEDWSTLVDTAGLAYITTDQPSTNQLFIQVGGAHYLQNDNIIVVTFIIKNINIPESSKGTLETESVAFAILEASLGLSDDTLFTLTSELPPKTAQLFVSSGEQAVAALASLFPEPAVIDISNSPYKYAIVGHKLLRELLITPDDIVAYNYKEAIPWVTDVEQPEEATTPPIKKLADLLRKGDFVGNPWPRVFEIVETSQGALYYSDGAGGSSIVSQPLAFTYAKNLELGSTYVNVVGIFSNRYAVASGSNLILKSIDGSLSDISLAVGTAVSNGNYDASCSTNLGINGKSHIEILWLTNWASTSNAYVCVYNRTTNTASIVPIALAGSTNKPRFISSHHVTPAGDSIDSIVGLYESRNANKTTQLYTVAVKIAADDSISTVVTRLHLPYSASTYSKATDFMMPTEVPDDVTKNTLILFDIFAVAPTYATPATSYGAYVSSYAAASEAIILEITDAISPGITVFHTGKSPNDTQYPIFFVRGVVDNKKCVKFGVAVSGSFTVKSIPMAFSLDSQRFAEEYDTSSIIRGMKCFISTVTAGGVRFSLVIGENPYSQYTYQAIKQTNTNSSETSVAQAIFTSANISHMKIGLKQKGSLDVKIVSAHFTDTGTLIDVQKAYTPVLHQIVYVQLPGQAQQKCIVQGWKLVLDGIFYIDLDLDIVE